MTQADRDRLVTLKKAKKRLITQREAAEELGLSVRQVKRLLYALKKRGDKAVVHGLRGKPSNRKIEKGTEREAVRILSAPVLSIPGARYAFFKAWRNLSGPMWFHNQKQNQTLGRDRATSRWSAPSPGSRTRREDHALSHRPQMSSGRLFLDRVGRHQSPSPLRRQHRLPRTSHGPSKGEISTLPARGHFYFALTRATATLTSGPSDIINHVPLK